MPTCQRCAAPAVPWVSSPLCYRVQQRCPERTAQTCSQVAGQGGGCADTASCRGVSCEQESSHACAAEQGIRVPSPSCALQTRPLKEEQVPEARAAGPAQPQGTAHMLSEVHNRKTLQEGWPGAVEGSPGAPLAPPDRGGETGRLPP